MAQRSEICVVAPSGTVGMEFLVFDPVYDFSVINPYHRHIVPTIIFMYSIMADNSAVRCNRVYYGTPAHHVEY